MAKADLAFDDSSTIDALKASCNAVAGSGNLLETRSKLLPILKKASADARANRRG